MIKPLFSLQWLRVFNTCAYKFACKNGYPFIYCTAYEVKCPTISYFICKSQNMGLYGKAAPDFSYSNAVRCFIQGRGSNPDK